MLVRELTSDQFLIKHLAKTFYFVLSFFVKAKSQRFRDIINIHRPYGFALNSALRLGFVVFSVFQSSR